MRNLIRHLSILVLSLSEWAIAGSASAEPGLLNPDDPIDTLEIKRKISCTTIDGEPAYYTWDGQAFSHRQGERDIHLFDVEGFSARTCYAVEDPERGKGYRLISREVLVYKDKDTGEVMDHWINPWTGNSVDVQHVQNDPVNFSHFEKDRAGQEVTWHGVVTGSMWRARRIVPLFYPNPLGGDFQKEVGGTYHATEMFNDFGPAEELFPRETKKSHVALGWVRMSDWLPWMLMNGREGEIYYHSSGNKIYDWDEVSPLLRDYIEANAPEYKTPPEDDGRRNMTSWKHYKIWKQDR